MYGDRIKGQTLCVRCVMDVSDPGIIFDDEGICNHCRNFDIERKERWFPNEAGQKHLLRLVEKIKEEGKAKKYDCLIGLSGGLDSSYLALKVREYGLRPLVMHVDAGWNSEVAVANIERIVDYCNYDLHTHVLDWDEMRDLQVAYLRSGVANLDVPQDHAFTANLLQFAKKNKIRYVLSGGNFSTEAVLPRAWQGSNKDSVSLKAIHREYGEIKLKHYNTLNFFEYYFWYPFAKGVRKIRPLDYMDYNKAHAEQELQRTVGYKSYAKKHGESLFTKVFQNYYLPLKFGFDKRRPHLSSLVLSGQITRDEALARLSEPLYEPGELETDIDYFCKKLKISPSQFSDFIQQPKSHYTDFPNWDHYYRFLKRVQGTVERTLGNRLRFYS